MIKLRSRLAKARIVSLAVMAILVLNIFSGINLVFGSGLIWYINFSDSGNYFTARSPYSGSFSIVSATWQNIQDLGGSMFFQNYGSWCEGYGASLPKDYGYGYMYTSADMKNFTFDIIFKPKWVNGTLSFDTQEIFAISDFINVWLTAAQSATPTLHVQLKTAYRTIGTGGVVAQFQGTISSNAWYDLIVTYNNATNKYYAFLNNKPWGSGSPAIGAQRKWWSASTSDRRTLNMAAYGYEYKFFGWINKVTLTDTFTYPYSITSLILNYHFDEGGTTPCTVVESANGYDGTATADLQYATGMFGYGLSGLFSYNTFGCYIPTNIPSITDKFSASMWALFTTAQTSTGAYTHYLSYEKTFYIRVVDTSPGGIVYYAFTLGCTIGGTSRTITSTSWKLSNFANKWLYFYAAYDGTGLTFAIVCQNNTVLYNSTSAYSGVISDYAPIVSKYGFSYSTAGPGMVGYRPTAKFDEFKLFHYVWGPYQQNNTWFGEIQNDSWTGISVDQNYWLYAQIQPQTINCNPKGTATLYVNASGNWSVRFAQADLLQYFTFTGFDTAFMNVYEGIISLHLTFMKTTNATPGNYNYSMIILNRNNAGAGPDDSVTVPFTLRVQSNETGLTNDTQYITVWANITLKNNPLDLKYTSKLSNKIVVWSEGWVRSSSAYGGPLKLEFGDLLPQDNRYVAAKARILSYVRTLWYIPATYNLSYIHEWFEVSYGTDEVLAQYGNMTWYHYYHISELNSPDRGIVQKVAVIRFYAYFVGGRLWVTVSQSTVSGKPGEAYHLALHLYSKPASQVYWEITQGGLLGYEATYVKWTGNPRQSQTNYSADLTITIPEAVGSRTLTIKAYDVKNPGLVNYTTLTVINTSPRAFSIKLIPDVLYVSWLKYPSTGYNVKVFIDCNVSHHFYLTVLNTDPYLYSIAVEYPQDVGTGPHLTADSVVRIVAPGIVYNGTYFIEYEAYLGPDEGSLYASAILTLKISDSYYPIPGRNQTSGNQTNPPLPPPSGNNNWNNNWSSIPTNFNVPVTGIGSGAAYAWVALFASSTGLPMMAAGFLIGLIFLVALMLIIGAGTGFRAPSIMYMIPCVAMTYFNTMIGVWDIWITVIITLFAIGMASLKIMGVFE